ncbi:MAG: hypothetical protein ACYDCO_25640 [Armatimonadota bacterium]
MRIMRALLLLMAVAAVALLAGCGGGGGTTPPDPSNGVINVDSLQQQVLYTPPSTRQAYSVYAYFQNTVSGQTVSALFAYDIALDKWTLDISPVSNQFNGQAVGDYNMSVWVVFADDTENPQKVGNTILIPDLAIMGGDGPPPPPF